MRRSSPLSSQTVRAVVLLLLGAAACRPTSAPPAPAARPSTSPLPPGAVPLVPGLPPIPETRGAPVALSVRYPSPNQLITARDSNFLLGSVGSGDVQLMINGTPVPVAPNGAFLAWLPLPAAPLPRYELIAVRGVDTVRRTLPVRYAARRSLPASGTLIVDSGSVQPARGSWALADELLRVSVRAPRNAAVQLIVPNGSPRPLRAMVGGAGDASPEASTDPVADVGALFATEVPAAWLGDSARPAQLLVTRNRDSLRLTVPSVRALSGETRVLGSLRSGNRVASDTDAAVSARTIVNGTYKWQLLPQTVLEVTARQSGFTRVRLDEQLDVWVDSDEIALLPEGTPLPRRVTGGFRVTPNTDYTDVLIATGERPAHHVEAEGRTLTLTLYGVQANPEISPLLGSDSLVRRIVWEQVTSQRVRLTVQLTQPAYGWLSLWDEQRRAFVLRVRRAPVIDAARPLAGLTIAVDPGHPPAGSTGPTGLYEGDAVFPVGQLLVEMLRERGARPVITRTSLAPVGLGERGVLARREQAHAFISVHLNALPDGVNPFTANGTSTLFYHNASEPLAREVQRSLQARFGLRDLGVHYQNLAVARPSWFPSALAEGVFLMIPEQEAAMRDPAFQRKYAEGLLAGLENYFRWLRAETTR
ncbi:N-acetylmuramoyl-L-alanine amidase [Gemmatimonas sp.]|uniref:N-acetylmuramoyl-L-alanine amidase family protein n=1 Tax=Gemmatimonas sp. TaxID=1962908 RepID=UPI0022CB88CB|nr:N-acetylmuramoyl-L-alanine amidase [Gemmatimonas sp.]MCZ8205183.1 N-acetylmuramoyl-L-alanine amidase [Gemmatimonas sp.]